MDFLFGLLAGFFLALGIGMAKMHGDYRFIALWLMLITSWSVAG